MRSVRESSRQTSRWPRWTVVRSYVNDCSSSPPRRSGDRVSSGTAGILGRGRSSRLAVPVSSCCRFRSRSSPPTRCWCRIRGTDSRALTTAPRQGKLALDRVTVAEGSLESGEQVDQGARGRGRVHHRGGGPVRPDGGAPPAVRQHFAPTRVFCPTAIRLFYLSLVPCSPASALPPCWGSTPISWTSRPTSRTASP